MKIIVPEYDSIPPRLFRLRWQFQYSDGKAARVGIWDGSSSSPVDAAWAVDKTNLARVLIEGEARLTHIGEVYTLLEVDGQLYASMQWEAYARAPAFFAGSGVSPQTHISGLSILTNDERLTVWVSGKVTRSPLADHDKQFKIYEHTAGA